MREEYVKFLFECGELLETEILWVSKEVEFGPGWVVQFLRPSGVKEPLTLVQIPPGPYVFLGVELPLIMCKAIGFNTVRVIWDETPLSRGIQE